MTRLRCVFCDCDLNVNEGEEEPRTNRNNFNFKNRIQPHQKSTFIDSDDDGQRALLLRTFSKYFCANFGGVDGSNVNRRTLSRLPFCFKCQMRLANLSELDTQLEELQLAIRLLVASLSEEIISSINNNHEGQGQGPSQRDEYEHDDNDNEEEERQRKRRKRSHSSTSSFNIYNPKMVQDYRQALYQSFSPKVIVSPLQIQERSFAPASIPDKNQFMEKDVPGGIEVDSFFQVFLDQSEEEDNDDDDNDNDNEEDAEEEIDKEKSDDDGGDTIIKIEPESQVINNQDNNIEKGEELSEIIKTEQPTIETEHHHPLIDENHTSFMEQWRKVQLQEHVDQVGVKAESGEISINETEEPVDQDPLSLDDNVNVNEADDQDEEEEEMEDGNDEDESVSNKYSYTCAICSEQLYTFRRVNGHMRSHMWNGEELRPYKCSYDGCNSEGFNKPHGLIAHEKRRHAKGKKITCPECQQKCFSKWEMVTHLLKHNELSKLASNGYKCGLCNVKPFNKIRNLTNHMLMVHSASSSSKPKAKKRSYNRAPKVHGSVTPLANSEKRPNSDCPSEPFPIELGLKKHLNKFRSSSSSSSSDPVFNCTFQNCTQSFTGKSKLHQHLALHMM